MVFLKMFLKKKAISAKVNKKTIFNCTLNMQQRLIRPTTTTAATTTVTLVVIRTTTLVQVNHFLITMDNDINSYRRATEKWQ